MFKHLTPRNIFLIDAIGAAISTLLLGLVLPYLVTFIGMPSIVLYIFALIAFLFSIYSFFCFKLNPKNCRPYLIAIGIANLLYCLFTLLMVIFFYSSLSILGISYFILEIIIIVLLASFELRTALSSNKT